MLSCNTVFQPHVAFTVCCGVVQVEVGGKYFYHRNMSTLVAFTVGGAYRPGNEFKVKDFFLSTILALFRVEYVPLVRYFSFLVKHFQLFANPGGNILYVIPVQREPPTS